MNIIPLEQVNTEMISVEDVKNRFDQINQLITQVMIKGVDYGEVGYGKEKKTLLKAGAEKLLILFRLRASFTIEKEIMPKDHVTYTATCTLSRDDIPVGSGLGLCSTLESKYRFQKEKDIKKDNENIFDTYNTVLKMAQKRALVAATLVTTGISNLFTQDLEDIVDEGPKGYPSPEPSSRGQKITDKQKRYIRSLLTNQQERLSGILTFFKVKRLADLTASQGSEVITILSKKQKQAQNSPQ